MNAVSQIRKGAHGDRTQRIDELVKDHGTSRATVYRYVAITDNALKCDPEHKALSQLVALLPDYSNNKAVTYSFDAGAIDWALNIYCESPGMSIMQVYKALKSKAQEEGWQVGSMDTMRRIFAYNLQ